MGKNIDKDSEEVSGGKIPVCTLNKNVLRTQNV